MGQIQVVPSLEIQVIGLEIQVVCLQIQIDIFGIDSVHYSLIRFPV